ncbi:MAG: DUF4301 family protein [Ignavibacteriaceae bacterium]
MNKEDRQELEKELNNEENLSLPIETIIDQIEIFKKGIPYLKLVKPCLIGDGIKVIPEDEQKKYISLFLRALDEGRAIKFVPASGAATRMFKKQLSVIINNSKANFQNLIENARKGNEDSIAAIEFIENINLFAFYGELKELAAKQGKELNHLIGRGEVSTIIRMVATEEGLNYSNLPKGCILFHSYPEGSRTAFEEHLIEAMDYSSDGTKIVKVHFTISPEHEQDVKKLFHSLIDKYSVEGWKFDIGFSFQSPSTDTISVTSENEPFRDEDGKIVFRPGGHGALLKNLNDLQADIILIKNIDNIVPDHLKAETYKFKKILGGYLIALQEKVFGLLRNWDDTGSDESSIIEIVKFVDKELGINLTQYLNSKNLSEKKKYLFDFLNRPIRVCGMVKKEGHPGGGPFWVIDKDRNISKQVVETAQVDLSDKNQLKILDEATHFSPVDFVCAVKDYTGHNFNLREFSNPETGLITVKSKNGKELKALELPGLWNGGMYYWLTVFVEVPKITFNPVKEINDLLKPEHQPLKL